MSIQATTLCLLAALSAAGLVWPGPSPQTPVAPAAGCASPAQRVDEERFVPVGGIEQWITIMGDSCANPVVLVLHGGPGNTLSPYAESLFARWEARFTIVQWDQRGAGRTYGRNPPPTGTRLTLARMTEDGVAVAEHVARHLGQPKVVLVGGSWGSILGIHMVKARPDLFHAYVGFAQVVSYRENLTASFAKVAALARASGDAAAVAALDALGAPPWKNPRSYGILRRATRVHEAKATDPAPKDWWIRAAPYDTPKASQHYLDGEDYSFLEFVGLEGDGMFSGVDLPALGRVFEVPIFIAQGAEDLVTVPEVARRYVDSISAPAKQFVLVPRAGHDPNEALLDAVFELVRRAASALPGPVVR